MKQPHQAKRNGAEKPVSLHPLRFETAVAALLEVKPDPDRERRAGPRRKAAKPVAPKRPAKSR